MNNQENHITPPRLAERLLLWMLKPDLAEEVLGDLDEKFFSMLDKHGPKKARRNYWYQVLNYMRRFALKRSKIKNSITIHMYKHYFKVSWRSLLSNKSLSVIKIGGFAFGIAACILISLYIKHELSYDKHYENSDRIFRLANNYSSQSYSEYWTNMYGPLKPILDDYVPEMDKVARVVLWKWGLVGENHVRPVESQSNLFEEGFFYADPEILEILEVEMVYGAQEAALTQPNSIVISQDKAEKYFPGVNPVGRQLILNDNPNNTLVIGGVMKGLPKTSHLQGDFIISLAERKNGPGNMSWCCTNYDFYVKLTPGADKAVVEQKLLDVRDTHVFPKLIEEGQTDLEDMKENMSYYLQPVENIYLNEELVYDHIRHGSAEMVWTFGVIAIVILVLACINFINLSTAKSINRANEVGVRKVVGARRGGLIQQHLAESVFYSFFSVALGGLLAQLILPLFNSLAAQNISLPWTTWWFIPLLLLAALVIGCLSGVYPAFYLSKFNPVQVLKSKSGASRSRSAFRSGMVVFQFMVTVVLIISALVTHQQFEHYMNKELGFEKDQVINLLGLNSLDSAERQSLKAELRRIPAVEDITLSDYLPVAGARMTNFGFRLENDPEGGNGFEAARWAVDEDYINTMKMQLVAGRDFRPLGDNQALIINERMASLFQLEEPLGTRMVDMFDGKYTVTAVVKDFHFESLTGDIRPLAMVWGKGRETLSLRVNAQDIDQTLASVTGIWKQFKPNQPIRYTFMDQRFEKMYDSLNRAKTLFIVFSVLSIVIACLGLFALSAYAVEQRSKEVSIRKVLGATIGQIFGILARDFIKLILIAIVIAIPLGWYFMDDMIHDMADHIELSWPLFTLAAGLALLIGLITISFESIKAALVNPAKTLRSE